MKTLLLILIFLLPSNAFGEYPFFVGDNIGQCARYIGKMNDLMGYPNPATKTERYDIPRPHATQPGKCLVILKHHVETAGKVTQRGVWSPKLNRRVTLDDFDSVSTPAEKSKRKLKSKLKAEGAFPNN